MAISGNFATVYQSTTKQPPAPLAFPDIRHNEKKEPASAWNPIPNPQGGGIPDEMVTNPQVDTVSRGLLRTIGALFRSHNGSRANVNARRAVFVDAETAQYGNAAAIAAGAAQDAASMAHRDGTQRFISPQQYNPVLAPFSGDSASIDKSHGNGAAPMSGKAIARGNYSFGANGTSTEYGVTGQRMPIERNWVTHGYGSPALGGMYSTNALRGVRPQIIDTPSPMPGIAGTRNSGIPGNKTWVGQTFSEPKMRRVPPNPSDVQLAQSSDTQPGYDDVQLGGVW